MHTTTVANLHPVDVVDTRKLGAGEVLSRMPLEPGDAIEQMALADHADWVLLRLVLCVAAATLLLAAAGSLSF